MKTFLTLILLTFTVGINAKTILVLGDSLTEGYHLSKEEAFPYLVEVELKKQGKDVKVINGGSSGATSASGLKRLDWYLRAKPDILILILGANDGLRGLKNTDTEKNLASVIEKAQAQNITVILGGMQMPTNYGANYRKEFEAIYPRLAKKYKIKLIPFILEGVGGVPEMNLPDGIHPNAKGHQLMAKTVLKSLEGLL
ncbi:MAG TPA: arylesterase [Bacteriovoracaceae bacterium]|nr:arylesterase [Bacteriovoracaceae bacterium]